MNNELSQIEKKSKVRIDKIKQHYSTVATWVSLLITILFVTIADYLINNYPKSIFSTLGLGLMYLALIVFLVFIIPLFTRLIIPLLIQFLMYILKMLSSLIK